MSLIEEATAEAENQDDSIAGTPLHRRTIKEAAAEDEYSMPHIIIEEEEKTGYGLDFVAKDFPKLQKNDSNRSKTDDEMGIQVRESRNNHRLNSSTNLSLGYSTRSNERREKTEADP